MRPAKESVPRRQSDLPVESAPQRGNRGRRTKFGSSNLQGRSSSHQEAVREATLTGISTRIAGTAALREHEILFDKFTRSLPVAILRFNPQGSCTFANQPWCDISGRDVATALGNGWRASIHPEDLTSLIGAWKGPTDGLPQPAKQFRVLRRDGTIRWIVSEAAPFSTDGGATLGVIATLTDVTPLKQTEEELRKTHDRLDQRIRKRTAALEIEMQERQLLERQILEIKDSEERIINSRLHEGLGQHLTGLAFLARALERDLGRSGAKEATQASLIVDLLNRAILQSRDLVRGIDSIPPTSNGLELHLSDLAAEMNDRDGRTRVFFKSDPGVVVRDGTTATQIFRIALEAIQNALQHSAATRVRVELRHAGDGAVLIVKDNGRGLGHPSASVPGKGLDIMKYRARLISACLDVRQGRRGGTEVTCWFPHRSPEISSTHERTTHKRKAKS